MKKRVEEVVPGEWVLHPEAGWIEVIGWTHEDDIEPDVLVWGSALSRSTKVVGHPPGTVIEVRATHPHADALSELVECPVCKPLADDVVCMWCGGKHYLDPYTADRLGEALDELWWEYGLMDWPCQDAG